jgi:hypothetical protein
MEANTMVFDIFFLTLFAALGLPEESGLVYRPHALSQNQAPGASIARINI